MATRFATPANRHFDSLGVPLNAGKLNFYEDDGGTTPKDTYSDNGLSTANSNPVILSKSGLEPNIFLDGAYRVTLENSDGVQIWERDNVNAGAGDIFAFDDWMSSVSYGSGGNNIVTGSDGNYYVSIQTPNLANDPTSSADYWSQIKFVGVWNTNETYAINDLVQGSNGLMYYAVISQSGNDPISDDGTNWLPVVDDAGSLVFISAATASNDATIEFTGIDSTYDEYEVRLLNVIPATDAAQLTFRTSTDGGSTFDSGASDYAYSYIWVNAAGTGSASKFGDVANSGIIISSTTGSDANELGVSGALCLIRPSEATYTNIYFNGSFTDTTGLVSPVSTAGTRLSAGDVDAIQFLFSAGNVESGLFALYGVKRS